MSVTTFTSRAFNRQLSQAKKATEQGVVYITDRGKPAHVLMTYQEYRKLSGDSRNLLDALAMPGVEEIDFDAPRVTMNSRNVDF